MEPVGVGRGPAQGEGPWGRLSLTLLAWNAGLRRGCRASARTPCPGGDSRSLFQPPWTRSDSR